MRLQMNDDTEIHAKIVHFTTQLERAMEEFVILNEECKHLRAENDRLHERLEESHVNPGRRHPNPE